MGGRAFGPPLCRGCAPATPPSKTIAHQPYAFIPAVRLKQGGCPQPIARRDSLNGGSDEELVNKGVLRGPQRPFVDQERSCRCRSSWSFVALSGPSWTKRSCRCRSSCPSWPLAALRGQKEVAVAVLRGPSWPLAALRGQKEVAVAVLRSFVALSGPPWTKRSCRCRSSWPFVALSGPPWTKRSCRCRSSWSFVALSGPSWTKRSCRCRSSWSFVALRGQKEVAALRGQKEVAVAVLRRPSWPFVDKKKFSLPLRGPPRKDHNFQFRQQSTTPKHYNGTANTASNPARPVAISVLTANYENATMLLFPWAIPCQYCVCLTG